MPMVEIVQKDAEGQLFTARSFLEYLRRSNPVWWSESQSTDVCSWVFRGHRNAGWKLVPSAARPLEINPLAQIIEGLRVLPDESSFQSQGQPSPINRERQLLVEAQKLVFQNFLRLGRELSFPVGSGVPGQSIFELGYLPHRSSDEVNFRVLGTDSEALAQHHGVPTYLLDWTRDPIIAGHFAASHDGDEQDLAVWALDYDRAKFVFPHVTLIDPLFPSDLRVLEPPTADNPFLASQLGLLTCLGGAEQYFDEKGYFPALDEVIGKFEPKRVLEIFGRELKIRGPFGSLGLPESYARAYENWNLDVPCLRKLVLPAEHLRDFRRLLRREGVTRAHLMPTLDNVATTALENSLDSSYGG